MYKILLISFVSLSSVIAEDDIIDLGIVGGQQVNQSKVKYQISLEHLQSHICGGVLLETNIVVTAAHCIQFETPENYAVRAGSPYLGTGGKQVKVAKIIRHKRFDSNTLDYDVAILKLAEHLKLGPNIGTIPLARKEPQEDTLGLVSGWGRTVEYESVSNQLISTLVPIRSRVYCYYLKRFFSKNMICAGYRRGISNACQGDSGGPLVINNELVGIVSGGVGRGCARPYSPVYYTNVAELRLWIKNAIRTIKSSSEVSSLFNLKLFLNSMLDML